MTPTLALKKSSSGDRINTINTTVSLVGKKTTTAFKKFFTRAESPLPTPIRREPKDVKKMQNQQISSEEFTPRPLTRSDTFVRTDSPDALMGETPVPVIGGDKRPVMCESTPLPCIEAKKELYQTHTFDATFNPSSSFADVRRKHILESTRISSVGFGHTIDIDSPNSRARMSNMGFDSTLNIDTTSDCNKECKGMAADATQIVSKCNETKTLNKMPNLKEQTLNKADATHIINKNTFSSQTLREETLKADNNGLLVRAVEEEDCVDKVSDDALNQTIDLGPSFLDGSGIQSPVSNATYSNPGSTDNLLMLDDVSIPSGFEEVMSAEVKAKLVEKHKKYLALTTGSLDDTVTAQAPDKTSMKLQLNSTMNTEKLIDLTQNVTTPAKHMQLLNLTKDYMDTPNMQNNKNTSQLLYMTQVSASCTTTPDRNAKKLLNPLYSNTPIPRHMLSPSLKQAQSDLVLPTRTPDEDDHDEPMDVDSTLIAAAGRTDGFFQQSPCHQTATSLQDVNQPNGKRNARFSFGLDLTESTLDCSIELVDVSLSSTILSQATHNTTQNISTSISSQQLLKKQNSFEMDESLGILTPDQMKEFLDSTATNNTNNNLDLPLMLNVSNNVNSMSHKLAMHQMRMDQTPSPEDLPLDPVEVKTDINEMVLQHQQQQYQLQQQQLNQSTCSVDEHNQLNNHQCNESLSLHSETEPSKSESMTKSSVSKISTSFITSVTSVTSLDTGYQGDGEMSRPASRGACDHSPSNGPLRKGVSRQPSFNQQQGQGPPVRRQDPMTDSDFFTESDADDIFNRGDRRAQVIDGQLYGPMLQPSASVFISEDPQMEDSCMESSGIFTDVENRGDEDLAQIRRQNTNDDATQDLSPDFECDADSTETVRSNRELSSKRSQQQVEKINTSTSATSVYSHGQGHLSSSQTSSTIQSSMSTDRLSAATLSNRTSYCSVDGGGSCVANATGGEFKSFASLDEAFDGESDNHKPVKLTKSSTTSTTSWCEQPMPKHLASVQSITSPRKHSSLTSLYAENGVHKLQTQTAPSPAFVNCKSSAQSITDSDRSFACTVSSSNLSTNSPNNNKKIQKTSNTSPGKYSPRSKTTPKSAKSLRASPGGSGSASGGGGVNSQGGVKQNSPPAVRKYHHHSPNKWDAVMSQIANNKAVIRKNYNDVKSKVSTRISAGVSSTSASGSGGTGSGGVSPTVRRSPTNNVTFNRTISPSISKSSKSPEATSASPKTLDNKRLMQNVKR